MANAAKRDKLKGQLALSDGSSASPSLSTPGKIPDIQQMLASVAPGLQRVERKMETVESSLFAPLAAAFVELIGRGGKRLRPALALLAAQAVMPNDIPEATEEKLISLAAAVEMLHTATLVHDDVIDGALLRRGAPTLNASWSQGATALAGNYMVAQAALFSAETGHVRVIELFSQTLHIIVEGELQQLFARNDYRQELSSYYQRIYAKTASLYSAACESAALLVGRPESEVVALRKFGYHFGMAFQIVDDILDFTGDDETLGKPAGSDLRQGTLTLPFFHYLFDHPDPDHVLKRLTDALQLAESGDDHTLDQIVCEVVDAVRDSGAIDKARQEAVEFLESAVAHLDEVPPSRAKESLLSLCRFVVERSH